MDIRLPNGQIIRDVPDNYTKQQVDQLILEEGVATEEDVQSWKQEAPEVAAEEVEVPSTEGSLLDREAPVPDQDVPAVGRRDSLLSGDRGQEPPSLVETGNQGDTSELPLPNEGVDVPRGELVMGYDQNDIPVINPDYNPAMDEARIKAESLAESRANESSLQRVSRNAVQAVKGFGGIAADKFQALIEEGDRSIVAGGVLPATQTLLSLSNAVADIAGLEITDQDKEAQQLMLLRGLQLLGADEEGGVLTNLHVSIDENGRVSADKPETFVGTVAPYLLPGTQGFKWIQGINALKTLPPAARVAAATLGGSTIADQLITDPYADNIFDMVEDTLGQKEGGVISHAANTVGQYLGTTEDSSELDRRLRMLGQDVLFNSVFSGTIAAARLARRGSGTRGPVEINSNTEDFVESVRAVKEDAKPVVRPRLDDAGNPVYDGNGKPILDPALDQNGNPITRVSTREVLEPTLTETGAREIATIEARTGTGFVPAARRVFSQIFLPGGYWTPALDKLNRASQNEQRYLIQRGNNIARRLDRAIENAARASYAEAGITSREQVQEGIEFIMNNVDSALKNGRQQDYARLPASVREEVSNARTLIDDLSATFLDSPSVSKDFKETVKENMSTYLRRSYEAFTNPNYVPDEAVRERAAASMASELQEVNPSMSFDDAMKTADERIDALLHGEQGRSYGQFINDVHKVSASTYYQRKDVPPEIRELLGEITNPVDNIILTVDKLARFSSEDRFARDFADVGEGRFLFDQGQGVYNARISGTNTFLDGKFTTPELRTALQGRQSMIVDPTAEGLAATAFRAWTGLKAFSQASKTVWSPVTHVKNAIGASLSRLANGSNPFSDMRQAMETVVNSAAERGNVVYDELLEKYQRYGLVGTNVRAGEMEELANTALKDEGRGIPDLIGRFTNRALDAAGAPAEFAGRSGNAARVVSEIPQKIYIGVDDVNKIAEFENYAATLRRAYPDASEEVIEQTAANVVKNTLFNYDMVPHGIKRLRNLPIGNFVGFPAEVARTSVNIVKVAGDELLSGNPVMYQRGVQRLAGWLGVAAGGFEGLSLETAEFAGVDREQRMATARITRTPWSEFPTNLYHLDPEDGRLFTADTSTLDPYEFMTKPVKILMEEAAQGRVNEEKIQETIRDMSWSVFKHTTQPFLSESLAAEAFTTVMAAAKREDGTDSEGRVIFPPEMPLGERMGVVLEKAWEAVEPGLITTGRDLAESLGEDIDRYTGEPLTPEMDLVKLFTGLNFRPLDEQIDLTLRSTAREYSRTKRGLGSIQVDYRTNPEDILEEYRRSNADLYRQQRELHLDVQAAITLGKDPVEIRQELSDMGLSGDDIEAVRTGSFMPMSMSESTWERIRREVFPRGNTKVMSLEEFRLEYIRTRNDLMFRDLGHFDTQGETPASERATEVIRERFALGGLVQPVPNAPMDPSMRKDKVLGGTYMETAADVNPLRMRLAEGGLIRKEKLNLGGLLPSRQQEPTEPKTPTKPDPTDAPPAALGLDPNYKGTSFLTQLNETQPPEEPEEEVEVVVEDTTPRILKALEELKPEPVVIDRAVAFFAPEEVERRKMAMGGMVHHQEITDDTRRDSRRSAQDSP